MSARPDAISTQKGRPNVVALGLCLLAMVCDGFDLTVIRC